MTRAPDSSSTSPPCCTHAALLLRDKCAKAGQPRRCYRKVPNKAPVCAKKLRVRHRCTKCAQLSQSDSDVKSEASPAQGSAHRAASDDVAVCSAGTCRTKTVVDVWRRVQRDGGSAAQHEAPTRRYDNAAATGCRRARCRHDICCPPTNYRCPLICATVRNVCATGEPRAVHTNGSSCPLPAQALTVLHRC